MTSVFFNGGAGAKTPQSCPPKKELGAEIKKRGEGGQRREEGGGGKEGRKGERSGTEGEERGKGKK